MKKLFFFGMANDQFAMRYFICAQATIQDQNKTIYMQIDAVTNTPKALVDAINKAIKEGDLKTWAIVKNDKDENIYSHTPQQWNEKAMMKPSTKEGRVIFLVSWWSKSGDPGVEVKGYILGRFTEILMVHFRNYFSRLETTA